MFQIPRTSALHSSIDEYVSFSRKRMSVRSPFGWHLIRVDERRLQDVTDERKRAAVRAALRQRKADEAYEDWLRQLRDSTYVDYRLGRE